MENEQAKKGPNLVLYAFILLLIGMGIFGAKHVAGLFDKQARSEREIERLGGTRYLLKMHPLNASITDSDKSSAVDVLQKRFETLGIVGAWVEHLGGDDFKIEVPKLPVPFKIDPFIRGGVLSFQMAHPDYGDYTTAAEAIVPGAELIPYADDPSRKMLVRSKVEIGGNEVRRANAASMSLGSWEIHLSLNSSGGDTLYDLSKTHNSRAGTGLPFAIILDGEILSAPGFNEPIAGGNAVISGNFTEAEARGLASAMQNPLPLEFELQGEEVIAAAP